MLNAFKNATIAGAILLAPALAKAENLKVVTSFSIIEDFARQLGGDRVAITNLVGPDGDAHVYEPKPADASALKSADVILINGLTFEGFMPRLVEASATKAPLIEVTKGVKPLKFSEEEAGHGHGHGHGHAGEKEEAKHDEGHDDGHAHDHGPLDPHAWQSVDNAKLYVANIADAFCQSDASGCDSYKANAKAYTDKLDALNADIKTAVAAIPEEKRVIITSHDAFGYFEHAYGIEFLAPEGVSTEAEASAADVAALIRQVREDKASAIFVENITNTRLIEQIASETNLKVGGTLYSDSLSKADGPAATYIDMMRNNIKTIKDAVLANG